MSTITGPNDRLRPAPNLPRRRISRLLANVVWYGALWLCLVIEIGSR